MGFNKKYALKLNREKIRDLLDMLQKIVFHF